MLKNYGQLFAGILIGLVLGLLAGRQLHSAAQQEVTVPTDKQEKKANNDNIKPADQATRQRAGIPQKVFDVLQYIRANNRAMPGYVGGRIFSNREELLPREDAVGQPVLYHEWDVNPKIEGQNRGTERIITGSDGRAWYTNDHYQTFKEIK